MPRQAQIEPVPFSSPPCAGFSFAHQIPADTVRNRNSALSVLHKPLQAVFLRLKNGETLFSLKTNRYVFPYKNINRWYLQ